MINPYQQVLKQYKSVEIHSSIETASPHELIELLLQGARTYIATAQGNIQRNQVLEKGENIGKALGIVDGLKASLNQEKGGEIASNLLALYEYIQHLLLKANVNSDADLLAEANQLIAEIHDAWQAIGKSC